MDDTDPGAPEPLERALASHGRRVLRHGELEVQLTEHDDVSPPDYTLCSLPHRGWRRYRLITLGERAKAPFDVLESQAFPLLDSGIDAAIDREATVNGAAQFGLDLLEDAHQLLHAQG
jgi:hypothetical protein